MGGTVTADGGETVTDRGVVYLNRHIAHIGEAASRRNDGTGQAASANP
jgi:hypothetical protein